MSQKVREESMIELIVDKLIHNDASVGKEKEFRSGTDRAINQSQQLPGAVIGRLTDFDKSGQPRVDYPHNPHKSPVTTKTTVSLCIDDIDSEVVMVFEYSKPDKPIVVGILRSSNVNHEVAKENVNVNIDGKRVVLNAEKDIVLSCGKASITLTKFGKILIRGVYVVSRSTGVNRIKGGSVQIN